MFGQLHIYSAYSFGKSTIKIDRLVQYARSIGLTHLALTDHHQMFGTLEFYNACLDADIVPIIGLEITMMYEEKPFVFTLLGKDIEGYHMLCRYATKLSMGRLLTVKDLEAGVKHLAIIGHACFEPYLLNDDLDGLMDLLRFFKHTFQSSFYIGLSGINTKLQENHNDKLLKMASLLSIPCICLNPAYYLRPSDAYAYHVLEAMNHHQVLSAEDKPPHHEHYLKSESEMRSLFSEAVIQETIALMLSCKVTLTPSKHTLPSYEVGKNIASKDYFIELCKRGLGKRFKPHPIPLEYKKRLMYELDIIFKMHYENYFLIVFDYVGYAKRNHILVGPGRGSAAGSLVAYSLGITNIDPIRYGLIFERFLNPERVSMPDIDIDFQEDRRDEVIDYVTQKYGQNQACRIIAFSSYGSKIALKEVGKTLGIAEMKIRRISEALNSNIEERKTLKALYKHSVTFKQDIQRDPMLVRLFNVAMAIEDLPRNISMHAAGVVLSNQKLIRLIPLCRSGDKLTSQYAKDYIEQTGLLKMDFLSLTNLTLLSHILSAIDDGFQLQDIPLNDAKTFKMLSDGDTFGLFQLESRGMKRLIMKMKIHAFEDLVMALALFRPGPKQNIDVFVRRKHGLLEVTYDHPDLKPILSETYGILIYQEQLMQIAVKFAGYSLAQADSLRKAISKKDEQSMHQLKDSFVMGCVTNGYERKLAIKLFDDIEKFANYGFNKAHGVSYAMLSYQLAYLKANYPLAFYSALLTTSQASEQAKMSCVLECRKYHVSILKPDINHSTDAFTIQNDGILFSLTAISGITKKAYEVIKQERAKGEFESFISTIERLCDPNVTDIEHLSRSDITEEMFLSLIDSGAFDAFEETRSTMRKGLRDIIKSVLSERRYARHFDIDLHPQIDQHKELLAYEKQALGVYLSGHPLMDYRNQCPKQTMLFGYVNDYVGTQQYVLFKIERVQVIRDKRGNNMCFITALDETGTMEMIVFSDLYTQTQSLLIKDYVLLALCKIEYKDKINLIAQRIELISKGVF